MGVEPLVRPPDQLAVGAPLIQTCLVTGCEQHGPPPWVEREGDAPHASSGPKAKLLHIAVARSIQCVHVRPAERRPERLEQRRMREKLILDDERSRSSKQPADAAEAGPGPSRSAIVR